MNRDPSGDTSRAHERPDPDELRLRKALGTVNDLEPPRDDLFVQRALNRGRARTARRRNTILGAAAGLVVVAAAGGALLNQQGSPSTSTAAGPPERDLSTPGSALDNTTKGSPGLASEQPGVSAARDASQWFEGAPTPQTSAFVALEPSLETTYPDIFSGAYATDATNTHIVVAVTRHDPALEATVTSAMPAPGDVSFVIAHNSITAKQQVAIRVRLDADSWRAAGVTILDVRLDGRTDRVVVVADEGSKPGQVVARYGSSLVRVVPGVAAPGGKLPNGATLPTLQR